MILRLLRICSILFVTVLYSVSPAHAADKMIGVIMTGGIAYYKDLHKAFVDELKDQGFGPGKAEIAVQTPATEQMSWVNAARKLVAIGSDVIIAYGAPAALAVLSETSDIPVVFAGVYDPAGVGVKGKNVTGVNSKVPVAGLLKNFKAMADFKKLGVIYNEDEKDTVLQANEVKGLEGTFGFQSTRFSFSRADDAAKISGVDALFLTTGCAAMHCVTNIIGVAHKQKIATATTIGGGEERGILLTITANPDEQGQEAAKLAASVLKGTNPSSLPVVQPKKIDFIINLKEATAMGLKVPIDLLTSATRVIK